MIASLGMYDPVHLQGINDAFWGEIRKTLGFGPQSLTRDRPLHEIWRDPEMLFAQTCGRPYRLGLYEQVHLIGTPDYGLKDCAAGYYYSVIIARKSALEARDTLAINGAESQSGWAAAYDYMTSADAKARAIIYTGGHAQSIVAVADGRADFAAIDAQTWHILQNALPQIQDVTIVATTTPRPSLPFITAKEHWVAPLRAALQDRLPYAALGIKALIDIPHSDYMAIPDVPSPMDCLET